MLKKISFAGPWITKKEIDYVNQAVTEGWYETFDMHVKKLEKKMSTLLGMKYALATHCCTQALHLSCLASGFKEGDEIICTDYSWVATGYAISYTKAKPVFVDIDPDYWCLDPRCIEKAITDKTKGIMVVHTFGHPAQMNEIMTIAQKYNLKVIEDAAPSLGASINGKSVGTFGTFGCFSFHGAKITASGEGGVLLTNDKELFDKASLFASMGRTDSQAVFWSDHLGYQYTMANITASLALAQVERVDELVGRKREIFELYYQGLKDCKKVKILREASGYNSNYCYPSILINDASREERDNIIKKLKELNIHPRPCFPRMSKFPTYRQNVDNPITDMVARCGISLPSAANLTEKDVNFVCLSLKNLL